MYIYKYYIPDISTRKRLRRFSAYSGASIDTIIKSSIDNYLTEIERTIELALSDQRNGYDPMNPRDRRAKYYELFEGEPLDDDPEL